jgi:hypothetical protein
MTKHAIVKMIIGLFCLSVILTGCIMGNDQPVTILVENKTNKDITLLSFQNLSVKNETLIAIQAGKKDELDFDQFLYPMNIVLLYNEKKYNADVSFGEYTRKLTIQFFENENNELSCDIKVNLYGEEWNSIGYIEEIL